MAASVTCFTGQGASERVALPDLLTPAEREETRDLTNRWIKSLRLVRYDTATMRQRFTYRGESLWWFTELYLHKIRHLEEAVTMVIALDRALERFAPARLAVQAHTQAAIDAAEAFGRARGLPVAVMGRSTARPPALTSYRDALSAGLSRLRRPKPWTGPSPRVAAFVHTAFWRRAGSEASGEESYIGPILDRLGQAVGPDGMASVGVGPARNYRARRWWDPLVRPASMPSHVVPVERFSYGAVHADSQALWRARVELARDVTSGPGVRDAAVVRGCDLWPVLERELQHAALLQWPWSARVIDEAGAALDSLAPRVVVTYAEAGGWGRAIMIAARRRHIPSVGIQHGFIYRHWLNYLHEPDEIAAAGDDGGFPAPDRTLLFDAYAAEHLRRNGNLPAESLVVTGSARLDELAARVDRLRREGAEGLRAALGVPAGGRLLVLAAKFSEIHAELPALFRAAGAIPTLRLVIKTHPAETPASYEALAAGAANISIAPADADLARLLAAADAVVTMNSTVAVDCLVLGVPAFVVGWPTNLSPFVDAGAMLGGPDLDLEDALERLLYDQPARDDLRQRAAAFAGVYRIQADGRAADRAANEILATIT